MKHGSASLNSRKATARKGQSFEKGGHLGGR